jgi:hypothetical protein
MYHGIPPLEKNRLLFMRSASVVGNNLMEDLLNKIKKNLARYSVGLEAKVNPLSHHHNFNTEVLQQLKSMDSMFLCWASKREDGRLLYKSDKSINLDNVTHIKVGAGKWTQCINIASESKTLMIKIDDGEHALNKILRGLLSIVELRK